VFSVSRTKPGAQLKPFIAETEHGHRLSAELDGCELKGRFVGHDPFPFVRGPMISLVRRELRRAVIFVAFIGPFTLRCSVLEQAKHWYAEEELRLVRGGRSD